MINNIRRQLLQEINDDSPKPMPTAHEFSVNVERFAHAESIPLIEALSHTAAEHDIDITEVPKLVSRALKEKIAEEESIPLNSATAALPM